MAALTAVFLAVVGAVTVVGLKSRSMGQQVVAEQTLRQGFQLDPTAMRVPLIVSAVRSSVVEVCAQSAHGMSTGSGIVASDSGLVLTNFHLVARATSAGGIDVRVAGEQENRHARFVGASFAADLAVVKVDQTRGLTPAPLVNSDRLQVGSEVIALGSPKALQETTRLVAVTALHRLITVPPPAFAGEHERRATYRAIQIDTALPARDVALRRAGSGGGLVDLQGRLVGLRSSLYRPAHGRPAAGQDLALPINEVERLTALATAAYG
ncbi:trypsin-like peptidase domain-containing protein [Actinopolymorpha sp. NPDC004070]|uniref:S1C family serine protease n=1 Tax=Actinopolymorpha sp. NPDC004070 TaxID=3154548 RepID=UPI0033A4D355